MEPRTSAIPVLRAWREAASGFDRLLPLDQPTTTSIAVIAKELNVTSFSVARMSPLMQTLGALKLGRHGQAASVWTRTQACRPALDRWLQANAKSINEVGTNATFDRWMESHGRKPRKPRVTRVVDNNPWNAFEEKLPAARGGELLVAARKDEPTALIEAARQYRDRGAKVGEAYEMLRAAGVKATEAEFRGMVELAKDERLEAVALVLPVIDSLERTVTRLTEQVSRMNGDHKELQELRTRAARQGEQIQRLVSNGSSNGALQPER